MKTLNNHTKSLSGFLLAALTIALFATCSTKKNTPMRRAYHNLTARYNVYFNGHESLKNGERKLKKTFQEDFTKILPIFRYEDEAASTMLAGEMDRTIKKCAKTIKTHSITAKPELDKKNLSREDQAFLAQPEYCKWIDDAYLIMGKAHFYKREFETARQTFLLVINKYKKDDTKYEAMLWLSKTYAEIEEYKNAENVLIDLRKVKKYDKYFALQMDLLQASMFLKQKDYTNASQKLTSAIEKQRKRKEKTRLIFILAQIYQTNAKYSLAEENYKKVIKRNPNYEMTFMAKIGLAEIFEKTGGNSSDLKKQLKKMVKDEKNVDYLDQLYYALGKIELNEKNTDEAIKYFTLSAQYPSSNNSQKVKTYMALADYYYEKQNYQLAEAYYDSTASSMESTFPDYETLYPKIKSRNGLTRNLNIIATEDSLQFVARMPEKDRNRIINGIINRIVEEERRQKEAENSSNPAYDPFLDNNRNQTTEMGKGKSYFKNPTAVSLGMTQFKKRWGDRKLADHWRRSSKQVVQTEEEIAENAEQADSTTQEGTEKRVTNVKSRDFYMQDLPLTEEKLAASNKRIEEALFESGKIYYKEMNEADNATKQFEKLLSKYPESENRLEALYQLYTIHSKEMDYAKADKYKAMIISEFPESVYAKILKDPAYVQQLKDHEKKAEDNYKLAYEKYKAKDYQQTISICKASYSEFPESELLPNFVYLSAMASGETGNKAELKTKLELLLLKYPDAEVTKTAKATLEAMGAKKYEKEIYSFDENSGHYYVVVFPAGKVDVNKLKFKYISLNAEHYTQEDLKIEVKSLDPDRDMIVVKSLKNAKAANKYFQLTIVNATLNDIRRFAPNHFVISVKNFETFIKNLDEAKYTKFFNENYLMN